jgi:hypothetical protein
MQTLPSEVQKEVPKAQDKQRWMSEDGQLILKNIKRWLSIPGLWRTRQ